MAWLRRVLPLLSAVAVSLAAALFVLYPAWLDGEHAVVGDWRHPDMISNHWLYRWVAERLLAGESLLHNDRYYFPVGDAPWLAGNGSDAIPYTALAAFVDWPGSVTWWCVLTLTLNGLAGWALARGRGAGAGGALVAAAALALCPYVAHEMMGMRLSQAPLYWLVGFLAAWMALLEAEGRRRHALGVLAGLLYGATAFVYWYYGLWAALAGAVLFAFRPRPGALVAFLPVAAATTLPPLGLFLRHWSEIPGTAEDLFPNPLAGEASLAVTFPLWGGSVERAEVTLSLVVLAGAAGWLLVRDRRADRWWVRGLLAIALLFYLLALGPELLLPSGQGSGIPGPWRLVYGLAAPLRRFWWPYRHAVVLLVALLPLAARGVDHLSRKAGRGAPLVVAALVALLPAELALRGGRVSVPVSWWEAPPAYERVAELPGEAILELPVAPQITSSQQTLSYQWVHHKALVNGHAMWVDRVRPQAWDAWVAENSFLSRLQEYERGQLFGPFAFRPEDVVALRELGVRHVVVNAEYHPRALYGLVPGYRELFTQTFGEPVLTFRDQLFAWDLELYDFQGKLDAPEFRLPADYLARDGNRMLDVGHNRPLGWRTVARLFPPVIPPRGEEDAAPAPDEASHEGGYAPAQGVAPPQEGPPAVSGSD